MSYSLNALLRQGDCNIPQIIGLHMRGLLAPLESVFGADGLPDDASEAARRLVAAPGVEHPRIVGATRDWVEWVKFEVKCRVDVVCRLLAVQNLYRGPKRPATILYLREFRPIEIFLDGLINNVSFTADDAGLYTDDDHALRDRVEQMFPDSPVIWVANPREALSYSFYVPSKSGIDQRINPNSVACFAGENWQSIVEALALSCDVIVLSNTKSDGGLADEVRLLRRRGLLYKTYVAHPLPWWRRVKRVDELKTVRRDGRVREDRLVRLPPMPYWVGEASLSYASRYYQALDRCWGAVLDSGQRLKPDAFASLFIAMATLMVIRGNLTLAGRLYRTVAHAMTANAEQRQELSVKGGLDDGVFHGQLTTAARALFEVSDWYEQNHDLLVGIYASTDAFGWRPTKDE